MSIPTPSAADGTGSVSAEAGVPTWWTSISPLRATGLGAAGFGAVSVLVYGTVAFGGRWLYRTLTEAGAYSFWAVVYLLGAPWLLGRLLAPAPWRRRYGTGFIAGFLGYAVGWIAAYFPLRDKLGEILASIVGPAIFAGVMIAVFRARTEFLGTAGVLILGHSVGYFAGDFLNSTIGGPAGMVLWGVCHGLGYGAAIGWASRRWLLAYAGTVSVQGLPPT